MIYNVKPNAATGLDDKQLIPVTDGTYYTSEMDNKNHGDQFLNYQTGDFVLCFYDSDGVTPITPTFGTITPTMSPIDNIWMEPGVGDTVIDATEVIVEGDGSATFSIPVFVGGAKQGKIVLAGITGATYVKAEFRRFK